MEEQNIEREESIKRSNDPAIYKLLVVGIVICMVGTYGRFAFDSMILSIVSWIILFVGAWVCCKAVFKMLQ